MAEVVDLLIADIDLAEVLLDRRRELEQLLTGGTFRCGGLDGVIGGVDALRLFRIG